jgi:hypothetical protein
VTHDFDRPVSIQGYDPNGSTTESLHTVSAALAYDSPDTGETLILVLHQAIHLPNLPHNLLSPMQMRLNDVKVHDTPKFLTDQPTTHDHAIVVRSLDNDDELLIPLSLEGVISTFWTRKPTTQEYESCPHYELTFDTPEYDPSDKGYAQQEEAMNAWVARLLQTGDGVPVRQVHSVSTSLQHVLDSSSLFLRGVSPTLCDDTFVSDMQDAIQISSISSVKATTQGYLDPQTLADNWGIGIETAKRTLKVTTQCGVRTVPHPTLSRRFRTNDRQLRYRRLPVDVFTDTMFSNSASRQGNRCAQVFSTSNGWVRAYPMKKKSEAHEALSLLFQRKEFQ